MTGKHDVLLTFKRLLLSNGNRKKAILKQIVLDGNFGQIRRIMLLSSDTHITQLFTQVFVCNSAKHINLGKNRS